MPNEGISTQYPCTVEKEALSVLWIVVKTYIYVWSVISTYNIYVCIYLLSRYLDIYIIGFERVVDSGEDLLIVDNAARA